jgi:hypothetical protein
MPALRETEGKNLFCAEQVVSRGMTEILRFAHAERDKNHGGIYTHVY